MTKNEVIKIANCSGFYGDKLSAAKDMVDGGPIDVLTGDYLAELAEKNNVNLEFEASVAGGIPILRTIKEGLATNKLNKIYGILNGTTNYILSEMENSNEKFDKVLDPHSAIGYGAFDKVDLKGNNIVLATAHPCKFPGAIEKAINIKAELPDELLFILDEKENYDIIDYDLDKIKKYIKARI